MALARHVFFGIAVAVSFTSEAVGVATDLIFGQFHSIDHLGPKILGVPSWSGPLA